MLNLHEKRGRGKAGKESGRAEVCISGSSRMEVTKSLPNSQWTPFLILCVDELASYIFISILGTKFRAFTQFWLEFVAKR